MPSSAMLHRVALVRTDVSEERIASIIRVSVSSQHASVVLLLLILSFAQSARYVGPVTSVPMFI
jgi:hypothetical protein